MKQFYVCMFLVVLLTGMVMHILMTNSDLRSKLKAEHEKWIRALDKHVVQPFQKAQEIKDQHPQRAFLMVDNALSVFLVLESLCSNLSEPTFQQLTQKHAQDMFEELDLLRTELLTKNPSLGD